MTAKKLDEDELAGPREQVQTAYGSQPRRSGYQRQGIAEAAIKSLIRAIAASLGRVLVRSIKGRLR